MQPFSFIKLIKNKFMRFANSQTLKLLLLFLFVFVITSLVEVITNFYEVKTPIVHGYFMWIMLFLFMCVILPSKSSQLTIPEEDKEEAGDQEEADEPAWAGAGAEEEKQSGGGVTEEVAVVPNLGFLSPILNF